MNRRNCVTVGIVVSLLALPGAGSADLAGFASDYYVKRIHSTHQSEAVRNAISKCLQGEYEAAIPVLQKHAQAGDPDTEFVLAMLYFNGMGGPGPAADPEQLFRKNAIAQHAPSMVSLADLIRNRSPSESLQLYTAAARNGDMIAAIRLGDIYESGGLANVQPNPKLAIRYFQSASNANNAYATFRLAMFHAEGKGVSPNDLIANRLFKSAAMQGYAAANTSMARRLLEGRGADPDPVAALGWLTRGARAGDTEAMVLLGQLYETGEGDVVNQDINVAGQLYSTAAKANDPVGKYQLAMLYYKGIGTRPDIVRAYVLLKTASGLPKAKTLLDQIEAELTDEQRQLAEEKLKMQPTQQRSTGNQSSGN